MATAKAPTPLPSRSEAEITSHRGLAVTVGGRDKRVPVLPIGPMRAWKQALADRAAELYGAFGGGEDVRDWAAVKNMAIGLGDVMLDLLLEYDVDGALGGREWLETHATEEEIYEAFKVMATHAFPFVRDVTKFPALLDLLLDTAAKATSTSSPSPSGASAPDASTPS
jgi:hypothetical protein